VPQKRTAPQTPQTTTASTPLNIFTPGFSGDMNNQGFSPLPQGFSPSMANMDLSLDFSGADFTPNSLSGLNGTNGGMEGFQNGTMNGQDYSSEGLNVGSFWQMPMALEWDWADMGARVNGYPAAGLDTGQGLDQGMNEMNGPI